MTLEKCLLNPHNIYKGYTNRGFRRQNLNLMIFVSCLESVELLLSLRFQILKPTTENPKKIKEKNNPKKDRKPL